MPRRRRQPPPLEVSYVAKSTDDSPDQTLTLTNNTDTTVRPTLHLVAHNMYGHPLPDVEVRSVLGTHLGAVMLPAHGTVRDILHFTGPTSHDVRHVAVTMSEAEELTQEPLEEDVRVVMIDTEQHATLDPDEFWGVGVANANPFVVQVRVALVAFGDPPRRDAPRQPIDVVTLDGDVTVASSSHEVIWLPDEVRGRFQHVAHALVPPTLV